MRSSLSQEILRYFHLLSSPTSHLVSVFGSTSPVGLSSVFSPTVVQDMPSKVNRALSPYARVSVDDLNAEELAHVHVHRSPVHPSSGSMRYLSLAHSVRIPSSPEFTSIGL